MAINQRSDVCAVPAAGVVAEAMVALVLAEAALEKFGGDSVAETRRNVRGLPRPAAERGLTSSRDAASRWSWSGRPAPGKTTVGRLLARAAGRALRRHRRGRRGGRPGAASPTSSSSDGEAAFRELERRPSRAALASTTACWRSAAARCSPETRAAAGRAPRRVPATSASPTPPRRVGLNRDRRCCSATRAPSCRACSTSGAPLYDEVATLTVDTDGRDRRRGRRRGSTAAGMRVEDMRVTDRPASRSAAPRRTTCVVGTGLLGELPRAARRGATRVAVVAPAGAAAHRRGRARPTLRGRRLSTCT